MAAVRPTHALPNQHASPKRTGNVLKPVALPQKAEVDARWKRPLRRSQRVKYCLPSACEETPVDTKVFAVDTRFRAGVAAPVGSPDRPASAGGVMSGPKHSETRNDIHWQVVCVCLALFVFAAAVAFFVGILLVPEYSATKTYPPSDQNATPDGVWPRSIRNRSLYDMEPLENVRSKSAFVDAKHQRSQFKADESQPTETSFEDTLTYSSLSTLDGI